MDPIQVNINISLELGDKTVSVLQQLLAAAPKPAQRKPAAKPETKPAPAPETKEAPAHEQEAPAEEAPQEQAAAEEAAPEAPATTEISDEELRQIVYNVRKAKPGNPQQIKNVIFPEFGIKTSIECPMERRAELVARLNELAA